MKQAYTNTIRNNKGPLSIPVGPKKNKRSPKSAASSYSPKVPSCHYGAACTRPGCIYRHPPRDPHTRQPVYDSYHQDPKSKICLPFLSGLCEYGRKCRHRHPDENEADAVRASYKSKRCSYGDDCRTDGCLYYHDWEVKPTTTCISATAPEFAPLQQQPLYQPPPPSPSSSSGRVSFDEWMQRGCPPPAGTEWDDNTQYWFWYYPDTGHQRPFVEVHALMYPGASVPLTCEDWLARGCPLPPQYDYTMSGDPWYEESTGVRRSHAEVFEILYGMPPPPTTAVRGDDAPRTSWARVAAQPPSIIPTVDVTNDVTTTTTTTPTPIRDIVTMPPQVWLPATDRSDYFYSYPDPIARFLAVNDHHRSTLQARAIPVTFPSRHTTARGEAAEEEKGGRVTLLDVHFQSATTVPIVLDEFLLKALEDYDEVWIVTGSGRHVATGHQRRE
eukprot:CAMPEP_0172501112 /NCGR_PEP_ID=MMETSP1066-20121228/146171_1 /TAXON_ID=671091 /ORGANISM="Coscinodiscus wailesii, Strain CCMP2513" /LENGTH=442 /DNA_ID=CAMNT_0013275717 /DNA_START=146 /DNA_END=1471 /DNA_ORIENTATION=+